MSITRAVSDTVVSGIGTSFSVAQVFQIDMGMFPCDAPYRGYVSLIVAQASAIAGGATTLTMRICRDPEGDQCIITDTTSQLFPGLTNATKGTACYSLNAFASLDVMDKVYVFLKTNAGSITCDFVEITWGAS